ncbi:Pentatricopeptide repeat-containing protein, mitochondrial [Sesamum alatum]|uniref:Pentatricopeptide repeat-containing protein, mitochondrial n=1 Tax=Sesamum alatum TaxID=300844 RepID=A0AAE1XXQ6_9LAMI|nr:Pentatricopeptide repeat-containing protein, mitochondrial [Sesamum alatum]
MNVRRSVPSLVAAGAARRLRLLSTQSSFSIPIPPLLSKSPPQPPTPPQNPDSATLSDFTRISELLSNPALHPGDGLEDALTEARISPSPNLFLQIFNHFDSTPKPLFTLFNWAQKRPDYQFSMAVFNAMVNSLGKAREFDSAWCLILDQIKGDPSRRPNSDTFLIMIRRYARAGLPLAAIRTFEYACSLDFLRDSDPEKNLFETLLDSLCKEGHVRIASRYVDKHRAKDPSWLPPIRMYNILLNGWFRLRKLKHAERLWAQMKKENVKPTVVTYGTIIEGLCRMGRPDTAMELLNEMKTEGVEPNAIVYNPIIDALGEAGRFKEALGMLERFSILELGPTISTYNSLVKGFCKAGDLVEASKILKMMIDNKCLPTPTTYSYFFKYFSKVGKAELGLNLYTKMIRSGYEPDRLTYHLLVKMLCKEGKLDLTVQIIKEMRARGFDLDLASSTMLMHFLWRMRRYDEAVFEFQDMFRRGIIPQYLTYRRMAEELERRGRTETAQKLHDLMKSVPHSTKLPDTYKGDRNSSHERKKSIIQRAEAMSDILKTCENPPELVKHKNRPENALLSAQKLTDSIQRKSNLRHIVQDPSIPSLYIDDDSL